MSYETRDPTPAPHPSSSPTNTPSSEPTGAPLISICSSIMITIKQFNAFDSDDLNHYVTLQAQFVNITHFAIAQTAENSNIERDSFFIRYKNSSASDRHPDVETKTCLFVNQSLCTFRADDLQSLSLIIEHESDQIDNILSEKLAALYLETAPQEVPEVSIYVLTQLSV